MMTEEIKPMTINQAKKLIDDSYDALMDLTDRVNQALKHELAAAFKAERDNVRGVLKITNKTTWAKAIVLENVLYGALRPEYHLKYLYGIRLSLVHCQIIGAAFADKIDDLKLDRAALSRARMMM